MQNFHIKDGYKSREEYIQFNDIYTDEYQDNVYREIMQFSRFISPDVVFDVGCGSGFKLIKYFGNYKTIGSEININKLKFAYPDRDWVVSDFNKVINADLIICADVIEHLINPDELMEFFLKSNCKYFGISTPERDIVRGKDDMGPPLNIHHVREWNYKEFNSYIGSYFEIIIHKVLPRHNQLIICQKK